MDRFLLLSAILDTYSYQRLRNYFDLSIKRNETFHVPIEINLIYYSLHEHKSNFSNKSLIVKALKKEGLVKDFKGYKYKYHVNPVEVAKEIEKLYSERKDRYTTPIRDRLADRIYMLKPLFELGSDV